MGPLFWTKSEKHFVPRLLYILCLAEDAYMPEYSAKLQSKVEYLWLERIYAAQLRLAWANIGNALSILLAILLTAHQKETSTLCFGCASTLHSVHFLTTTICNFLDKNSKISCLNLNCQLLRKKSQMPGD